MRLPMLLPPDSIEFIISLDIPWFCSNRLPALCFVGVTISRTNSPLVSFLIGTTWWSIQHGGTTSSSSGNEEPLARKRRAKKTPEHQQNQLKTREKCWDNSNSVRPMKIANESPDPRTDETPTNEPNPSAVTEFFFSLFPYIQLHYNPPPPKKRISLSVFSLLGLTIDSMNFIETWNFFRKTSPRQFDAPLFPSPHGDCIEIIGFHWLWYQSRKENRRATCKCVKNYSIRRWMKQRLTRWIFSPVFPFLQTPFPSLLQLV